MKKLPNPEMGRSREGWLWRTLGRTKTSHTPQQPLLWSGHLHPLPSRQLLSSAVYPPSPKPVVASKLLPHDIFDAPRVFFSDPCNHVWRSMALSFRRLGKRCEPLFTGLLYHYVQRSGMVSYRCLTRSSKCTIPQCVRPLWSPISPSLSAGLAMNRTDVAYLVTISIRSTSAID